MDEEDVAAGEVAQFYAAAFFDRFGLEHPGVRIAPYLEQDALSRRELGAVGFEIVLHQGAAGGGVAEVAGVPLQESVNLALVEFDVVRGLEVVALGAPPVGWRMPAFHALEHIRGQAVANLLVVVGFGHSLPDYRALSRFVTAAVTIEDMISCRNLTRRFGDFTAVDGLNLEVAAGAICAFLGPNGAGKSTTVKMMTGLLAPTSGEVTVCGLNAAANPLELKRRIGVLPEDLGLFDDLTVEEHLLLTGDIYGVPRQETRARTDATAARAQPGARAPHLRRLLLPRHAQEDGVRHGAAAQSRRCCSWTNRSRPSTR